jgi:hypothetical protein
MKEHIMVLAYLRGFRQARIAILIAIFAASFFLAEAQSAEPINIDEVKIGELSWQSPQLDYSLVARAGETLDIRMERIIGDIVPQFTVLRGSVSLGVWYAYQHGTVLDNFCGGQIRFDSDAEYTIRVSSRDPSSTSGKFFLSISTTTPPTALAAGQNSEGEITSGETRVFAFQSTPQAPLLAMVELKNNVAGVMVRLKNNRGDILGSFEPPVQQGFFNIPQGQRDYSLEIVNGSAGSVIQFIVGLTALGSESPDVVLGSNGLPIMPNAGDCIVATRSDEAVNIRTEPSLNKPAFAAMSPSKVYPVIARNQEASWYQIQSGDHVGWVAAIVTRLGGDCRLVPAR